MAASGGRECWPRYNEHPATRRRCTRRGRSRPHDRTSAVKSTAIRVGPGTRRQERPGSAPTPRPITAGPDAERPVPYRSLRPQPMPRVAVASVGGGGGRRLRLRGWPLPGWVGDGSAEPTLCPCAGWSGRGRAPLSSWRHTAGGCWRGEGGDGRVRGSPPGSDHGELGDVRPDDLRVSSLAAVQAGPGMSSIRVRFSASLLGAGLVLAACASSGEEDTAGPTSSAPPASSAPALAPEVPGPDPPRSLAR